MYSLRFYFSKTTSILDKENQIKELNNYYFNPKEVSMLSDPINEEIIYDKDASIELIKWSPNKIIFKTQAKSKQFLNISEIFYPDGWVVNSNIKIYEVNSLIRGIIIDSGSNIYTMEYKPKEIKRGSLISLMSLFILCLLITIGIKNEDKK